MWLGADYAGDPLRSVFLRKQSEQLNHSHPAFDGEVYQKVRFYDLLSEEDTVEAWTRQLSPNKQALLSRLLKRRHLINALDSLLPFPAAWYDFKFGSVHKHLAIHCDELLICYLRHFFTTWDAITLGEEDIREALDVETIQNLHQRAPSASSLDRRYIEQQMDLPSYQSALFPGVEDREKRNMIKRALLRLEVIIPTFKSFQKNVIYIGIGANIVETLLLDEKEPESTYKAMCDHWTAPGIIEEETREGHGHYVNIALEQRGVAVRFCFVQVFLAALRQFPNLSDDAPLIETDSKKRKWDPIAPVGVISGLVDQAYKTLFLRRAQLLGFRTRKIEDGLREAEDLTVEIPEPFVQDNDGEIIKRRSGTPYTNAYKQFRTELFLPNLRQVRAGSGLNPSVMFVQRDLLNAFFSWAPGGRDFALSAASIALPEPVAPLEHVLPGPVYRHDAAATPEQRTFVGRPGDLTNSSPRGLVASPQSTRSSEYTLVMSPQLRASSELSQGTEGHWSQFSLPALDESDLEEGNELQNQRGRSLASMSDDHRSFPAPELRDEDYERRASPAADLQDTDVWSPASIDDPDRRSFPELELRNGDTRDERRSFPEPESRYIPAGDVQDADYSERQPLPAPDLRDGDTLDDSRPSSVTEAQSTSAGSMSGRRSFPALGPRDVRDGRRSFPAPELHEPDTSERRRIASGGTRVNRCPQTTSFAFVEYNGMRKLAKFTDDMERYLQQRQGWTMMVLQHKVLKTIRFEYIVEHMKRLDEEGEEKSYFLIAPDYAEHFRKKQTNNLRST